MIEFITEHWILIYGLGMYCFGRLVQAIEDSTKK